MEDRRMTRKEAAKAVWMLRMYKVVNAERPGCAGKTGYICWDTASHLYNQGIGPIEAATVIIGAAERNSIEEEN
jgi:hypothetical protein